MNYRSTLLYNSLLAALISLSACERTIVCTDLACPAFPQNYRGLLPTDTGEVLSFTDGTRQIDFKTTVSYATTGRATQHYTTKESEPCGDYPPCWPQSDWDGQSTANAIHPSIRFWYTASYGDTTRSTYSSSFDSTVKLWWTPNGPNASFRYYPTLGDPAQGDSVALNFRLGNRTYDRVVIVTADTAKYSAPDVWRVYFANLGGVVGFESRYTRTLFWQQ